MSQPLENDNPVVYGKCREREITEDEEDDDVHDEIDVRDVFDMIKGIKVLLPPSEVEGKTKFANEDPEYPLTLEELNVVQQQLIHVSDDNNYVDVQFTPTVPHCSMATIIGLSIVVQLLRSLPSRFKITIRITPGTHFSERSVNKQLNDKERVAAALENSHLAEIINHCIAKSCIKDPK